MCKLAIALSVYLCTLPNTSIPLIGGGGVGKWGWGWGGGGGCSSDLLRSHIDSYLILTKLNKIVWNGSSLGQSEKSSRLPFNSPWTKWPPFRRRHFQMHFSWMKSFVSFIWISLKFVPKGPIDNKWVLVQLIYDRRQAITWTNADPVHWHIYAALGGDELTPWKISCYSYLVELHWKNMHVVLLMERGRIILWEIKAQIM